MSRRSIAQKYLSGDDLEFYLHCEKTIPTALQVLISETLEQDPGFATRIDVSVSTLQRIKYRKVSAALFVRLCEGLGVTPMEFFADFEDAPSPTQLQMARDYYDQTEQTPQLLREALDSTRVTVHQIADEQGLSLALVRSALETPPSFEVYARIKSAIRKHGLAPTYTLTDTDVDVILSQQSVFLKALETRRQELNLSYGRIATLLNVHHTTVQRMFLREVCPEHLGALAHILRVDLPRTIARLEENVSTAKEVFDTSPDEIPQAIYRIHRRSGLTVAELAEKAGVGRSTLYRALKEPPSSQRAWDVFQRVCTAVDATPHLVLMGFGYEVLALVSEEADVVRERNPLVSAMVSSPRPDLDAPPEEQLAEIEGSATFHRVGKIFVVRCGDLERCFDARGASELLGDRFYATDRDLPSGDKLTTWLDDKLIITASGGGGIVIPNEDLDTLVDAIVEYVQWYRF